MLKNIIQNTNKYGASVSTQDWLKFLAIITMTIDHIGWCFVAESSPYYEWFRIIGRTHVPVWFFFAGYSLKNKVIDKQIVYFAIWLIAVNLLANRGFFCLNVLVSVIICRACVLWLRKRNLIYSRMWDIFFICVVLSFFTSILFEYGTTGLLYAIMGEMVRHQKTQEDKLTRRNQAFFCATFVLFMLYQYIGFDTNIVQSMIMTLGVGYYTWRLAHFEMRMMPWFDAHHQVGYIVRLLGRNTLYYYVIHRSIFVLASYYGGFHNPPSLRILGLFGL